MKTMLEAAKAAKTEITRLTPEQKNAALYAMAGALIENETAILSANKAGFLPDLESEPDYKERWNKIYDIIRG